MSPQGHHLGRTGAEHQDGADGIAQFDIARQNHAIHGRRQCRIAQLLFQLFQACLALRHLRLGLAQLGGVDGNFPPALRAALLLQHGKVIAVGVIERLLRNDAVFHHFLIAIEGWFYTSANPAPARRLCRAGYRQMRTLHSLRRPAAVRAAPRPSASISCRSRTASTWPFCTLAFTSTSSFSTMPLAFDLSSTLVIGSTLPVATTLFAMSERGHVGQTARVNLCAASMGNLDGDHGDHHNDCQDRSPHPPALLFPLCRHVTLPYAPSHMTQAFLRGQSCCLLGRYAGQPSASSQRAGKILRCAALLHRSRTVRAGVP